MSCNRACLFKLEIIIATMGRDVEFLFLLRYYLLRIDPNLVQNSTINEGLLSKELFMIIFLNFRLEFVLLNQALYFEHILLFDASFLTLRIVSAKCITINTLIQKVQFRAA